MYACCPIALGRLTMKLYHMNYFDAKKGVPIILVVESKEITPNLMFDVDFIDIIMARSKSSALAP
jgi:hypothetical protein